MNCGDWEERIALYAGGDLAPEEARAVERHLAECAGCQRLLSGLREGLRFVGAAHAEPVEEAHFAAVRARVLSELERGPARGWRRPWAYAMVAAALLLAIALWPRPSARIVAPAPPAPVAAVARVQPAGPVAAPAVHHRTRPRKIVLVKAEEPAEPLVVKLLTDDPNVIIYWITDSKGE